MDSQKLQNLLGRLLLRDPTAADEIEALGRRLIELADGLRKGDNNSYSSTDGIGDRVTMEVVGPDGKVKHRTP